MSLLGETVFYYERASSNSELCYVSCYGSVVLGPLAALVIKDDNGLLNLVVYHDLGESFVARKVVRKDSWKEEELAYRRNTWSEPSIEWYTLRKT